MDALSKSTEYQALVNKRKACHACRDLINPAIWQNGKYDGDEIGPWSRWQGNLDAKLLVIGQDWGDVTYFEDNRGVDKDSNPTNRNLMKLLKSIGLEIKLPSVCQNSQERGLIFLTNAILCLKEGRLQAAVKQEWFDNCGKRFLRPLVELISPRVVVALGERAFMAVLASYNMPQIKRKRFSELVERQEGFNIPGNIKLFPAYHCGARILNTHRNLQEQMADWKKVKCALAKS